MNKVLIVNHSKENCGVQQFGKRVADLSLKSEKVEFIYLETNEPVLYKSTISYYKPDVVIYNWYPVTMGWLDNSYLDASRENLFIFHDGNIRNVYDGYLYFGVDDWLPNRLDEQQLPIPREKKHILPRPLFHYETPPLSSDVISIGSFGFGFHHKGFEDIIRLTGEQFTHDVEINFHITNAHYGDANGQIAKDVIRICREEAEKYDNIQLNITTDFKSTDGMLDFLAGNSINLFHYNNHPNHGISSVLDYALSVDRPLGLSDNSMFRHVLRDEINLTKRTIRQILFTRIDPVANLRKEWSNANFILEMERLFA